jgi:hypothetical protein
MSADMVETLLEAAERWTKAKAALDRCNRETEYDRGYFCHDDREAESAAREAFGSALVALIDSRVGAR